MKTIVGGAEGMSCSGTCYYGEKEGTYANGPLDYNGSPICYCSVE